MLKTQRNLVELDRAQALGLLERAPFGRVAFIFEGFPTIRPYNHVLVDGEIFVNTRQSTAFAQAVVESAGLEVAFQADEIEPHHRLGWSVVVSGIASEVTDRRRAEPLARQVRTWIDHPMNIVIVIKPQVVSGFRLTVAN